MPNRVEGNRGNQSNRDGQTLWAEYLVELEHDGYVGEDECQELTSLSRTTRWRLEDKGQFPSRVRISPGRVGWLRSELSAWSRWRAGRRDEPTVQA